MNRIIKYIIVVLIFNCKPGISGFTITGSAPDFLNGKTIHLINRLDESKTQSKEIINGQFSFHGEVVIPTATVLLMEGFLPYDLLIDNSQITVDISQPNKGNSLTYKVNGSKSHSQFEKYKIQYEESAKKIETILLLYEQAEENQDSTRSKQYLKDYRDEKSFLSNYVRENSDSYTTTFILFTERDKLKRNEKISLLNILNDTLLGSRYLVDILRNDGIGWEIINEDIDLFNKIYSSNCSCFESIFVNHNTNMINDALDICSETSLQENHLLLYRSYKKLQHISASISFNDYLNLLKDYFSYWLTTNCEIYNQQRLKHEELILKELMGK